jgi:hypothetical protein
MCSTSTCVEAVTRVLDEHMCAATPSLLEE